MEAAFVRSRPGELPEDPAKAGPGVGLGGVGETSLFFSFYIASLSQAGEKFKIYIQDGAHIPNRPLMG